MPQYRDISVNVCTRGPAGTQTLEEYGVAIDASRRTVTCWISSEERKEFVITAFNQSHTQAVRCLTRIDGRAMDHALWRPQEFGSIEGAYLSENTLVPFVFARIQVTDEENMLNGPPDMEALGTISFAVLRCTVAVEGLHYAQKEDEFDLHDIGPIHERAKKLGGHCVSLGDETQAAPALTALTHDLDNEDSPYCIFVFRCRPRDLLQAQGIIPHYRPTATAGPSRSVKPASRNGSGHGLKGTKRLHESNTSPHVKKEVQDEHMERKVVDARGSLAVQEARIAAQLEAVRAQMARLEDHTGDSNHIHKRVKREPGLLSIPSLSEKGKGRPEVVDLTIDD